MLLRQIDNWIQFCILTNFVFHVDFADGRARVFWEDRLSGFIPKTSFNVPAMVVIVPWFRVESVIMAKQTLLQWMELRIQSLIGRKSGLLKLRLFWTRVKLPYFNKITLDRSSQHRSKTFYGSIGITHTVA
jgi:hypothetical protein